MGIVLHQSFKNMVTTYLGFAVGAINVLLLYPSFLTPKYYGLITFLLSASTLIWPILGLGVHNTLIKFYSSYKTEEDQQKLLSFALIFPLLMGLVLGAFGFLFYENLLSYFNQNALVQPYVWVIFIIAISIAYFEVFFAWGKLKLKSVFGNFMREVFHRICVMILLLLVYYKLIDVPGFVYSLVLVYALRSILIMIYAFNLLPPKIDFRLPSNKKSIYKYSFLIFIAGTVATALLDLDKVMIEHYLPIENVSVYGIAVYVASVIAVPSRAMLQILNPITAKLLNNKEKENLGLMYKKSSVTLLAVSGLIFCLIITNINQLYALMPNEYEIEVSIVILLCLVKLFDNLIGNNNSILLNSDHYRLILVLGIAMVIIAFLLNIWLIPTFNLLGAAIASFVAFFLYNTSKLILVYQKFKLHPFTRKTLLVLLLISILSLMFYYIKIPVNPIFSIPIKSAILSLIYLWVVYRFNFSDDITQIIEKYIKKQTPQ